LAMIAHDIDQLAMDPTREEGNGSAGVTLAGPG